MKILFWKDIRLLYKYYVAMYIRYIYIYIYIRTYIFVISSLLFIYKYIHTYIYIYIYIYKYNIYNITYVYEIVCVMKSIYQLIKEETYI